MLEVWLISIIAGLGLLAFFEPCTIATHTLFAVRTHQQDSQECCNNLLSIWLSRSLLVSAWLVLITLTTTTPTLENTTMAFGLFMLGAMYLISRKVYLPVPHLEGWRLFPRGEHLPDAIRLGLTLPACTLPLLVVVSVMVAMMDNLWLALLSGVLWSTLFSLPIFYTAWRGVDDDGRDFLNHAASSTPYLTASLFVVAAIFMVIPEFNLKPAGLESVLDQASLLGIVVGFLAGFIFSFNPVAFASIPVVLAYVTQAHEERRALYLGGAFIAGLIVTHVALGVIAALGGEWVQSLMGREWGLFLGPLLIVMGLMWAGVIRLRLPWFSARARKVSGFWGAFLLGIPFSVAICPFCAPALMISLTASAAIGSVSFGFALLLAFALGRSIPIILGAWAVGWLESLQILTRYQRFFDIGGGVLLILSGLYLLNEYLFLIKY